jgi:hypothetical protein
VISEFLNSECFCVSLDQPALRESLAKELGTPQLTTLVEERCPYLFSASPVFVSDSQTRQMAEVIHAVESVVSLPAYQEYVLSSAPAIAWHSAQGAKSVFFGYDFHIAEQALGVIEINTNAGGAMLNAVMARAHHTCCLDDERMARATSTATALEESIVEMFFSEWKLAGRDRPLKTIAIVDSSPQQQYLYPEFILFQRLFERNGLHVIIADPGEFEMRNGLLMHGERQVDLVYNRLTDFMLESPEAAALRAAYLEDAIVLTPHPRAHALYADKRNMAILCSEEDLRSFGVSKDAREVLLKHILRTELVTPENAERLWSMRRGLFFKPTAGYGGRAAYRGDKLTKRVWSEILAGNYVAQAMMAPGERVSGTRKQPQALKFDIRCYAYNGRVQWTAARIYQGQTTNFRTLGGGFAPVYSLPDVQVTEEIQSLIAQGDVSSSCCQKSCS